ncbi:hypothetical protein OIU76_018414 [Salix suchowensis]|nr:hypothetical protein OIU76_018414 [Salix suchowensis]
MVTTTAAAAAAAATAASTSSGQQLTHTLSAKVRKTIQSIKEIVGNFSDADIYMVLKETNMDPNETAQKLLNQGLCLFFSLFNFFVKNLLTLQVGE